MSEAVLCPTEQIKPQHIVGEDSMDNDDEPRKGELQRNMPELHEQLRHQTPLCAVYSIWCDATVIREYEWCQKQADTFLGQRGKLISGSSVVC